MLNPKFTLGLYAEFKFKGSGFYRCTSKLPDYFYRKPNHRPKLVVARDRLAIKAWGGRDILTIKEINGIPVKFVWRDTAETFNRYEAKIASKDDILQIVNFKIPHDIAVANSPSKKTITKNLQPMTPPTTLADLMPHNTPTKPKPTLKQKLAERKKQINDKAAKVAKTIAQKIRSKSKKRKRSYADKIKAREEWIAKQVAPTAAVLPTGKKCINLNIIWYSKMGAWCDGILDYKGKRHRVWINLQTLWGRPDLQWWTINIQRPPDTKPSNRSKYVQLPLPPTLKELEGKFIKINGKYAGRMESRYVPGFPTKNRVRYGMQKVVSVMPKNQKITSDVQRDVAAISPRIKDMIKPYVVDADYESIYGIITRE